MICCFEIYFLFFYLLYKLLIRFYIGAIKQTSGDSGANVKRLEQETEAKIHHLKNESSRISHDFVQLLLRHVSSVKF